MIFKKITFRNYKTFYGTQEIDLYIPPDVVEKQNKNIILLGGLNGAGKTTFLKAILYILFGKRGITSSTSKAEIEREYIKLFSNVINNTFFEENGRECSASLILETDSGAEWTLSIKWYVDSFKKISHEVRELTIKENAHSLPKKVLVENIDTYNSFIDRIIPFYAAPFFIFDGEEIRSLIEKQNTDEMKTAIKKISGINANQQLIEDLSYLKNQLMKEISKVSNSSKVNALQQQFNEVDDKLQELKAKSEQYKHIINTETEARTKLQNTRQEKLLTNSKSRETISVKIGAIDAQLTSTKKELNQFFKENMISIILNEKIQLLKARLSDEKKYREKKILHETKLQPYEQFINKLFQINIDPPLSNEQMKQLKEVGRDVWLQSSDQSKIELPQITELHDLNNTDLNYLANLQSQSVKKIIDYINMIDRLQSQHETILAQLKNAPEAADTSQEENLIRDKTTKIAKYQMLHSNNTRKINTYLDEKRSLEAQITKNKAVGGNADQLYAEMQYLDRTIKGLIKYEEEYTSYKANLIKEEFEKMLLKLFRKQEEFGKIEFDTNTFSIRLYNDKMREISIQDRSAGEMQMISSSLIWALTRASNLKLPVVIDTPLGRLDSYHRSHLIEHYYRHLGNQVIILSTDTEITKEYVDIMEQSSYKQYMLDYNESKKYTIIRDGYFQFIKGIK